MLRREVVYPAPVPRPNNAPPRPTKYPSLIQQACIRVPHGQTWTQHARREEIRFPAREALRKTGIKCSSNPCTAPNSGYTSPASTFRTPDHSVSRSETSSLRAFRYETMRRDHPIIKDVNTALHQSLRKQPSFLHCTMLACNSKLCFRVSHRRSPSKDTGNKTPKVTITPPPSTDDRPQHPGDAETNASEMQDTEA